MVILARECGLQVGLDDLQVSSLVPQPLQGLASADEFMQQLPQVRFEGRVHRAGLTLLWGVGVYCRHGAHGHGTDQRPCIYCAATNADAFEHRPTGTGLHARLLTACCNSLLQFDGDMAAKAAAAANTGCVMRYVGRVDVASGAASVSVQNYPSSHPFAQLSGSENMIVFTTERYSAATPLVVRGPGAGAEVTAAGVFGDLLAVLRYSAGART